jgi:hypothetical protein
VPRSRPLPPLSGNPKAAVRGKGGGFSICRAATILARLWGEHGGALKRANCSRRSTVGLPKASTPPIAKLAFSVTHQAHLGVLCGQQVGSTLGRVVCHDPKGSGEPSHPVLFVTRVDPFG